MWLTNRPLEQSRTEWKGDYAEGELRAEIAAAFMLADLGVPQIRGPDQSQAYLRSGCKPCGMTTGYIFRAGTAANKAADYILSFSPSTQPEPLKCRSEVGGVVLHGAVACRRRPVRIFLDRHFHCNNNQQRRSET